MPNRILKESITTSDTIDALSAEEERFFCRLLVVADDFGRADARAAVLRAKCFPLKVDLQLEAVEAWLAAICRAGLARTYHVDGRRYLEIVTWREHQNVRAKASKFPDPVTFDDEQLASADDVISSASKCDQAPAPCEQALADVPVLVLGSRSSDLEAREADLGSAAAVADGPRSDATDAAAKATPPAKPERKPTEVQSDGEAWMAKARDAAGVTAADWPAPKGFWPRYAAARKSYGADRLLASLDGHARASDGFWLRKGLMALLGDSAIQAGIGAATGPTARGRRPAAYDPKTTDYGPDDPDLLREFGIEPDERRTA